MARGVPVACSSSSATGEIAGAAALLFDPRDPRAIATAVAELLVGGPEIERLRRAGLARAAEFTWGRTAHGLLETYARALAGGASAAARPSPA
jgi:glycosyltransferase involved in cell wall biosynthesis